MRSATIPLALALAGCAPAVVGPSPEEVRAARAAEHAAAFASLLEQPTVPRDPALYAELQRFYAARGGRPAFTTAEGPTGAGRALRALLADAAADGLDPARYTVAGLADAFASGDPAAWASAEHALAAAGIRYAGHLAHGRVEPVSRWETRRGPQDLAGALSSAVRGGMDRLRAVAPSHPQYRRLRDALARYRAVDGAGWPDLPDDVVLEEGDPAPDAVVGPLAARLVAEGWLAAAPPAPPSGWSGPPGPLGGEVLDAVRRFQAARGLPDDGVLGPETWAALDVPVAARIAQLERNLDRWRWVPDDLGQRHLRVNIPSYGLELVQDGERVFETRVVVGRPDTATPVFSDELERIVFSPYWNVPMSIGGDEILPKVRANPGWLTANGYEVVDARGRTVAPGSVDWSTASTRALRFRQKPGRGNALGRMKFLFPNDHAVYLHDTPARDLFDHPRRAYSHGCVRVADPLDLADTLLDDWTIAQVKAAADGGHRVVELPAPVPVHLLYFTAEVADDGTVRFYDDVYGLDADHAAAIEALRERPPRS